MSDQQAIIRTGNKQYRVELGNVLRVDLLPGDVGSCVEINDVLLLGRGENARIGTPVVPGAKVKAEIVRHGRGRKIIVYKYRRRKMYRRKNGHRQGFTELKITEIAG